MLRHKHSLIDEFPQCREQINQLKHDNPTFAKMAAEYHTIDHQLCGLTMRDIPTSDENYLALKKRRVKLKDQIYAMLVH